MPISTNSIALTIRTNHCDLASIVEFYESEGVKLDTLASVVRFALADFAGILRDNSKSREFDLREAIERVSHLRGQKSHMKQLRVTTALEIGKLRSMEMEEMQAAMTGIPAVVAEARNEPDAQSTTAAISIGPEDVDTILADLNAEPDLTGIIGAKPDGSD